MEKSCRQLLGSRESWPPEIGKGVKPIMSKPLNKETARVCQQCGAKIVGIVRYTTWVFCSWECKKEFREERD
jgi:hypothetical protein